MKPHALELMGAFVEVLSENDGYAVLRHRGRAPGYVHVVPPGLNPNDKYKRHVSIERYNGRVTAELRDKLIANERPEAHERPDRRIQDDPLGYSAGRNYGRFKRAFTYEEIVREWESEIAFARDVAVLLRGINQTGRVEVDVEGDYDE